MKYGKEDMLRFYKKMYEIRQCDDRLARLKLKDLVMNGFHPYMGEEAVAVGVCDTLKKEDYVVSTHRPQGHSIAKGSTIRSIYCEMLGRIGGPSNGLGGPMQWIDAENNFFCGSIVGSGVCSATGFGLSIKKSGKKNVCVCIFGDGASNTGSFHEGLNLASIWKLPIVFVCENNQYGEAMPVKEFVSVEKISQRAAGYSIEGRTIDGMDVKAVAGDSSEFIQRTREGEGPFFLETVTYRYRGHYMGDPDNYRTKEEIAEWRKRDPVDRCRKELIDQHGMKEGEIKKLEEEIEKQSYKDQEWALAQPKPTLEYAVGNVLVPVAGRDA